MPEDLEAALQTIAVTEAVRQIDHMIRGAHTHTLLESSRVADELLDIRNILAPPAHD